MATPPFSHLDADDSAVKPLRAKEDRNMCYDLAVIGNDEPALEMLCVAASAGQKTVAILPESRHSSWLMAQALRRLVVGLLVDQTESRRGLLERSGTPRMLQRLITRALVSEVTDHTRMLERLGVDVILGEARFSSRNKLTISRGVDFSRADISAVNIVVGTGVRHTAMHRPLGLLPFQRPEALFEGVELPKTLCIIGGDDFGAGLCALFSLFGVDSRLLAREDNTSAMLELATLVGVTVAHHPEEIGLGDFGPGSSRVTDIIDCRRAVGFTEHLNLPTIGVEPDENGRLWCAGSFETWCSGVFGIGEVIGFSSNESLHPTRQAERILNRMTHRIRPPHFLRSPSRQTRTVRSADFAG